MTATVLEIIGGAIVVSGIIYYFINKSKTVTTTTKTTPTGGSVTTINVPAGFVLGVNNVLLKPVTIAAAFTDCVSASASLPSGSYQNGLSWNEAEYLRQMSAKDFGTWCAGILQVSAAIGGQNTVGWLTGLSNQGQGFLLSLTTQGLVIPNTDPRS